MLDGLSGLPSPRPAQFRKRYYRLSELIADSRVLLVRRADIRAIWGAERLDPGLREQVMLAVATVNACGFCTYVHREAVLQTGGGIVDAAVLVGLDPSAVGEADLVAVMWAQARAQEGLRPAPVNLERALTDRFTAQQRRDLDTVVRVMTRANLMGNTLEVLVRRVRGQKVPGSRFIDELPIGLAYAIGAIAQGLITARRRGKPMLVAAREAADSIRTAAA